MFPNTTNKHSINFLDAAPISKSFPKAIYDTKTHAEEEKYIPSVIQYIESHLDDKDVYATILIEDNLKWLSDHLQQCQPKIHPNSNSTAPNFEAMHKFQQRHIAESGFIKFGLHKLLNKIISKYQEKEFLDNGLHRSLIYFALKSFEGLCIGQNQSVLRTLYFETDVIRTALSIMNNDALTWLEQTECAMLIMRLLAIVDEEDNDKNYVWTELQEKYGLNVIKLLIKECVNCFKLALYHKTLDPYHYFVLSYWKVDFENIDRMKTQDDMPSYKMSALSKKNQITKNIHYILVKCRIMTLNALKFMGIKYRSDSQSIEILFSDISSIYLKRLLQISTLYMREGNPKYPPTINSTDPLAIFSIHKCIAEKIANDHEIIEILIIGLRSRGRMCEYNYREIVIILYFIIVEYELLPGIYVNDAILALIDLIEQPRKNLSMSGLTGLTTLITMIIKSLKYLFKIPKYSRIDEEEYICAICQNEYDFPHAIPCGHNMCYNCLTPLLYVNVTNYQMHVLNYKPTNHCPVCREPFEGKFNRDDKLSAFVLNRELYNKMNASLIVIEKDDDEKEFFPFKGTECEYYVFLKEHNDKEGIIRERFDDFCDFMMMKTKVYDENNINKDRTQDILLAKKVKKEGNTLFKEKKYDEAIKKYKECLLICPLWHSDRAIYYGNIGICYMKLMDWANLYRTSQNALSVNPVSVKPMTHSAIALSKMLLTENNNLDLMNKNFHSKIFLHSNNLKCLVKRVYDILLHQISWDCYFYYVNAKAKTMIPGKFPLPPMESIKMTQEMCKNDELLQQLTDIQRTKIERGGPLNHESFQHQEYVDYKNDIKKDIHDFIVDQLLINDDKMGSMTMSEVIKSLNVHYKDKQSVLKWINPDTIIFIANHSHIMCIAENKVCLCQVKGEIIDNYMALKDGTVSDTDRNETVLRVYSPETSDNMQIEKHLFENLKDIDNLITACLYDWEQ